MRHREPTLLVVVLAHLVPFVRADRRLGRRPAVVVASGIIRRQLVAVQEPVGNMLRVAVGLAGWRRVRVLLAVLAVGRRRVVSVARASHVNSRIHGTEGCRGRGDCRRCADGIRFLVVLGLRRRLLKGRKVGHAGAGSHGGLGDLSGLADVHRAVICVVRAVGGCRHGGRRRSLHRARVGGNRAVDPLALACASGRASGVGVLSDRLRHAKLCCTRENLVRPWLAGGWSSA
jgi:hypothetical protein